MDSYNTERLTIRHFQLDDADFIINLLNQKTFIDNIVDKGVRNQDDARQYLQTGPMASYKEYGFGLSMVLLKETGTPIGMCGLIKRDTLEDPDIGYALLPEYCGKGYALEAATEILESAHRDFNYKRVVAITTPDNKSSIGLLEKIGFSCEGMVKLSDDAPECKLFGCNFN